MFCGTPRPVCDASHRSHPLLLRCLLAGIWHKLSDPALQAAIADRLSFRRFVRLSLHDRTPDHTTLWRFRQELAEGGLIDKIFTEINRQFEVRKLILKQGTLVDASLMPARANPPRKARKQADDKPLKPSADRDARWGRKGKKSVFGYKVHTGVDAGHTLIRRVEMTDASVTDTEPADQLICGDEKAAFTRGEGKKAAHRPEILTFAPQSACLPPTKPPGKQRHVLCAGHRSGHHILARDGVSIRHFHRRHGATGIPAAFSGIGLGRARARGHLDLDRRHLPRGAEESRRHRQGHRRHRDHQPARDHRGVGPRHRPGGASRHRLAGPPHRRHLRQTESRRPRAGDLGENGPDRRSLFLRHQGGLDPRPCPRRARPRRTRRADVRHRRLLSAVAPHRRQGARDRRHQRLAHAAVQHPQRRVGRRAVENPARAALDAP